MGEAERELKPVVEPKRNEDGPTSPALARRIRQQEILAELGVLALQGASFDELMGHTARLTAEGMGAEFCKVLQHIAAENCFLVRAGVGWERGVVGIAKVGADLASPAGFALRTGKPVISNHLENENRFRTPELLARYGIHRAMNVILQGEGRPFGVLEVDSRSDDEFTPQDLSFLQGAANILGMAIERERHERSLKTALERQQLLLKEIMHRVKNSLGIVASMLKLQAVEVNNAEMTRHLDEAAYRVSAVAKAHERIYQGSDTDKLDLGIYLEQVCLDLDDAVAICDIKVMAERGIEIMTDRAIPIALIANEMITNAAKHAHKDGAKGTINVRLGRRDEMIELSIEDAGVGLPPDFNMRTARGLGMRIVEALAKQLGGTITVHRLDPGTRFLMAIPLKPRSLP